MDKMKNIKNIELLGKIAGCHSSKKDILGDSGVFIEITPELIAQLTPETAAQIAQLARHFRAKHEAQYHKLAYENMLGGAHKNADMYKHNAAVYTAVIGKMADYITVQNRSGNK